MDNVQVGIVALVGDLMRLWVSYVSFPEQRRSVLRTMRHSVGQLASVLDEELGKEEVTT